MSTAIFTSKSNIDPDSESDGKSCPKCKLKHCNGKVHENPMTPFVYPTCHNCGIELCDLIELLEDESQRDPETCEMCSLKYTQQIDPKSHFEAHFYKGNGRCESRFHCLSCTEKGSSSSSGTRRKEQFYRKEYIVTTVTEHHVHEQTSTLDQDSDAVLDYDETETDENQCDASDSKEYSTEPMNEEYIIEEPYEEDAGGEDNDTQESNDGIYAKMNDIKTLKCKACPRTFKTLLELVFHENHFHCKSNRNQIKCPICAETFPSISGRMRHVNDNHRDPKSGMIKCLHCSRQFRHISNVEEHLVIHGQQSNFVCDICGKGFRRLGNLQGHYGTHNDETSYECNLCTKTFKTQQLRRKHIQYVHSAEKRVKCEICGKGFGDHSDLRRHRWSHGGYEKQFECSMCDMKFYEHRSLRKHELVHFKRKNPRSKVAKNAEEVRP